MNSIEQRDESGTWVLVATGFTTPIEDNSPKVIRTCACPELGYWCAEYITNEMKNNLDTPEGKKLRQLIEKSEGTLHTLDKSSFSSWKHKIYEVLSSPLKDFDMLKAEKDAILQWKNLVGYNCKWDHKPFLRKKIKETLDSKSIKYSKDSWCWCKLNDFDYYYDIWSNIHYGFIGYHAGFFAETLKTGASVAQFLNDFPKVQFHPENVYKYHYSMPSNAFDDIPDQISIMLGIELAQEKTPSELSVHHLIEKIENVPLPWGKNGASAKRKHQCYTL